MVAAGLSQSCRVTKDYSRPELNLPENFDNTKFQADGDSINEMPDYASFFKNRELITLLDSVTKNNLDLRVATENILASEAMLKNVKLNYLPDVNLQVNAGVQRLSKNSMTGTFVSNLVFQDYTLAPAISWEVDFWGKLKRQREEVLATYLGQKETRRALRVQLIAEVATAYYNLLSLDKQLSITTEVERTMEKTLDILKTQYSVGEVNSIAVKQSEAQLAETRALIPEIKASIKAQENALRTLTGNYPGAIKRSGNLEEHTFGMDLQTGIPADLLANRPDIKQSEFMLMAANARLGIAKTSFYPSLNITAQAGINSISASKWFLVPASLFGNATAGLTQPIFNRRRIKSAYEQAQFNLEAAVHGFRKSVLVAVEEVSTSMSNIEQAELQGAEVANRKEAMDKAIEDAGVLYKYGDATYIEVLAVQQGYLQAEMAQVAVRLKGINAYISLYKSLGGN